jgi:hypothetical protein
MSFTGDTTRKLHFKITVNQDVRIYVNVSTMLDIALKTLTAKVFQNTSILLFFCHTLSCFHLIYIKVSH